MSDPIRNLMVEASLAERLVEARRGLAAAELDLELDDAPRDTLEGRVTVWRDRVQQLERDLAAATAQVVADARKLCC